MKSNNLVWYKNYISSDVVQSGHSHVYLKNCKYLETNLRRVSEPPTGPEGPLPIRWHYHLEYIIA